MKYRRIRQGTRLSSTLNKEPMALEGRGVRSKSDPEAEMKRLQTQLGLRQSFPPPSDEHKDKNCIHPVSFPIIYGPLSSCPSGSEYQGALSILG